MGLDVYFVEDIGARLAALEAAARHYPPGPFRQGWLAALEAVALAFGIPVKGGDNHEEEAAGRPLLAPML